MRSLLASLTLAMLLSACRLLVDSSTLSLDEQEAALVESPLALGSGYVCRLDKKGQGACLGSKASAENTPFVWQTLRAAGSTPVLRSLVARATVTCGVGVKPPSLNNRILCWQPQASRAPRKTDVDAILLSGKLNRRVKSLSMESSKVCALLDDGQVACGNFTGSGNALKIYAAKNLRQLRSLRSGESFSCGIRSDSAAILCWGDNSKGQVGGQPPPQGTEPMPLLGFNGPAIAVEAGSQHACAINEAGEVFCWGANGDQQLAQDNSEQTQTARPQIVRGLPDKAAALALGEKHSCAQLIEGSVFCWGAAGFLGSPAAVGLIPAKVPLPLAATQIAAGVDRSCARLINGGVSCWGSEALPLPEPHTYSWPKD